MSTSPVRHIVAFRFKAHATDEQISKVTAAFRDLGDKISGLTDFEFGTNNSPEGKSEGFTQIYMVTFDSVESRDAYLPHPDHAAVGDLIGNLNIVDEVFVLDYEVRD